MFVCFTFTATTPTTTTTGCLCLLPFFQPLLSTVVVEKLRLLLSSRSAGKWMDQELVVLVTSQPAVHCYTEFCPVSAVLEHERTTFSKRKRERESWQAKPNRLNYGCLPFPHSSLRHQCVIGEGILLLMERPIAIQRRRRRRRSLHADNDYSNCWPCSLSLSLFHPLLFQDRTQRENSEAAKHRCSIDSPGVYTVCTAWS